MSRTISEIYSQAKAYRDQYLQITEVGTEKLSGSKMSVMNVLTYVMSVLIYTFENTLDIFKLNITKALSNRINGTPEYYVYMAKKFQPNNQLIVPEDGTDFYYENNGQTIITHASYEEYPNHRGIILKVAKGDSPEPLSDDEYAQFNIFINRIKFVGSKITVRSWSGDIIIPNLRVVYDDAIISKNTAINNVQQAIKNYINNIGFNSIIYESAIIDAIQSAEGVVDVPATKHENGIEVPATLGIRQYNYLQAKYNDDITPLTSWTRPASGFLLTEEAKKNTFNDTNIEFEPKSKYLQEHNTEE